MQRGKLIVISAPSGSGKTTIAKEIMKLNPMLGFSVSATTRQKRDNETEGKDYYFLSDVEFKQRIEHGDFVEWEEVYPGKLYGTLKDEVEKLLSSGRDILFDLDVKGGLSIKEKFPEACLIFIRPPSFDVLKQRLQGRQTEDEATVSKRLERVPLELDLGSRFEYQVVNDGLQQAVDEVQTIVEKHLHH